MINLFIDSEEEIYERTKHEMEFNASIHGAEIKSKNGNRKSSGRTASARNASIDDNNVYEYGDTSKFENMSEEEKEQASNLQLQQLMGLTF